MRSVSDERSEGTASWTVGKSPLALRHHHVHDRHRAGQPDRQGRRPCEHRMPWRHLHRRERGLMEPDRLARQRQDGRPGDCQWGDHRDGDPSGSDAVSSTHRCGDANGDHDDDDRAGTADSRAISSVAVSISVFPAQGPCSYTDTYGAPRSGGRAHEGVDIIAKAGQWVYAVSDGTLTKKYLDSPGSLSGNGWRLTIAGGTYFFYAHLSAFAPGLSVGSSVKAGQIIGQVGMTGDAPIPHLHFEVHPGGGASVNPTPVVKAVDACKSTTAPAPTTTPTTTPATTPATAPATTHRRQHQPRQCHRQRRHPHRPPPRRRFPQHRRDASPPAHPHTAAGDRC